MSDPTYHRFESASRRAPRKRQSFPMAHLVRLFAARARVDIGETFDASAWAKPLGALYRYFHEDVLEVDRYFERAIKYLEDKHLAYTPHTLYRDLPLIDKWIKESKPKSMFGNFKPKI